MRHRSAGWGAVAVVVGIIAVIVAVRRRTRTNDQSVGDAGITEVATKLEPHPVA
jgi:hypothetical protein